MPSSQINSSGYHSIKGRTRLDGVELEKCGGEHDIRWGRTRRGELDRGRTRCNSKISLHIIVLIVHGCFDRTHGMNKLFLHLMRRLCLCLIIYDGPFRIFPCMLLTRNHMIFLVQFVITKHLLIFSKTTNCTRPTGSCNFVTVKKFTRAYIFQIALEIM